MENFDNLVAQKKAEIKMLELEKLEIENDRNLIPEAVVGHAQGKYRITSGSKVSDSRCENPFAAGGCGALGGNYFNNQIEQRQIALNKHVKPIQRKIDNKKIELIALEEKSKLPLLRNQLFSATAEYRALSSNDPEFRQKQIDQRKELYKKSTALDALERKHNLFGTLPTNEINQEVIEITPEPITVYKEPEIIRKSLTTDLQKFDYSKLAIAGAGIFAILAIIIWRLK